MPILLQINIVNNVLSTGKICEDISRVATKSGWHSFVAYGRSSKPGVSQIIRIGNAFDTYQHYFLHKVFDREGLASKKATIEFIKWVKEVQPDIIQLHNIHDHYLNYPILFEYLSSIDTPIVWVQHDCWAFTGGCMYNDLYNCDKWKSGCSGKCPNKRAILCNNSDRQFELKKSSISRVQNLTFVPVSDWLNRLLKESAHSHRDIRTIHNGIDIQKFHPIADSDQRNSFSILGVAAVWDARKGLEDFIKLREILPREYNITLVGLSDKQLKTLPSGITGIKRTTNIEELVQLYSNSDVFVNPTYSDNFPTVNLEALACGTPVITYNTGGSPEAIDEKTGVVVEQGNVEALAEAIKKMKEHPLSSEDCRQRAVEHFDKDKCFQKYIDLYEELLAEKK